jgi:hypothetical protein
VRLHFDTAQAVQDLQLLSQAAQRSLQLRCRLFDFVDVAQELRFVHVEDHTAATRDALVMRLELSQGLADLVAAVRAGEFDAL